MAHLQLQSQEALAPPGPAIPTPGTVGHITARQSANSDFSSARPQGHYFSQHQHSVVVDQSISVRGKEEHQSISVNGKEEFANDFRTQNLQKVRPMGLSIDTSDNNNNNNNTNNNNNNSQTTRHIENGSTNAAFRQPPRTNGVHSLVDALETSSPKGSQYYATHPTIPTSTSRASPKRRDSLLLETSPQELAHMLREVKIRPETFAFNKHSMVKAYLRCPVKSTSSQLSYQPKLDTVLMQ